MAIIDDKAQSTAVIFGIEAGVLEPELETGYKNRTGLKQCSTNIKARRERLAMSVPFIRDVPAGTAGPEEAN
jgi:hypothetical protein